jgi:hypothetical protein
METSTNVRARRERLLTATVMSEMPADGISAAAEKRLRHVLVGSSANKLPQSRGDAKGGNVSFWRLSDLPPCPNLPLWGKRTLGGRIYEYTDY